MNILLGVGGGIAAYKTISLTSQLMKMGHEVQVVLTRSAEEFVKALPYETLSHRSVVNDLFTNREHPVAHIELAEWADLIIIAPATADLIGKIANGIADDFLTTMVLAYDDKLMLVPAMNDQMYANPIVQENMKKLERLGHIILAPRKGWLACGHVGMGKMLEPEEIARAVDESFFVKKDLLGKSLLVTAGPTREFIDPVRYITNHSSGKMGYAIAEAAAKRGASVTLISGPTRLDFPKGVKGVSVQSTREMFQSVKEHFDDVDALIMAAAPADFRPESFSETKLKKEGRKMHIEWVANPDILKWAGEHKKRQKLIGFAAESDHLAENAQGKCRRKNLDFIVANDITQKNAGFGLDVNTVNIYYRDSRSEKLPTMSKSELADELLNRMCSLFLDKD